MTDTQGYTIRKVSSQLIEGGVIPLSPIEIYFTAVKGQHFIVYHFQAGGKRSLYQDLT